MDTATLYQLSTKYIISMEGVPHELVKGLISAGYSYKSISQQLKELYPHIPRGLSKRSVRRFVKDNNLRASADLDVLQAVEESVSEVCNLLARKISCSCYGGEF